MERSYNLKTTVDFRPAISELQAEKIEVDQHFEQVAVKGNDHNRKLGTFFVYNFDSLDETKWVKKISRMLEGQRHLIMFLDDLPFA